ncbi:hypothetical protein D3C71_1891800 [compost metagenome]
MAMFKECPKNCRFITHAASNNGSNCMEAVPLKKGTVWANSIIAAQQCLQWCTGAGFSRTHFAPTCLDALPPLLKSWPI